MKREEKGREEKREREREIIRSMTHHKGEKVEASLTELPVNNNGEEIPTRMISQGSNQPNRRLWDRFGFLQSAK